LKINIIIIIIINIIIIIDLMIKKENLVFCSIEDLHVNLKNLINCIKSKEHCPHFTLKTKLCRESITNLDILKSLLINDILVIIYDYYKTEFKCLYECNKNNKNNNLMYFKMENYLIKYNLFVASYDTNLIIKLPTLIISDNVVTPITTEKEFLFTVNSNTINNIINIKKHLKRITYFSNDNYYFFNARTKNLEKYIKKIILKQKIKNDLIVNSISSYSRNYDYIMCRFYFHNQSAIILYLMNNQLNDIQYYLKIISSIDLHQKKYIRNQFLDLFFKGATN
jgi:hypothetical protein